MHCVHKSSVHQSTHAPARTVGRIPHARLANQQRVIAFDARTHRTRHSCVRVSCRRAVVPSIAAVSSLVFGCCRTPNCQRAGEFEFALRSFVRSFVRLFAGPLGRSAQTQHSNGVDAPPARPSRCVGSVAVMAQPQRGCWNASAVAWEKIGCNSTWWVGYVWTRRDRLEHGDGDACVRKYRAEEFPLWARNRGDVM